MSFGVATELTAHQLQYIIDIARPTLTMDEILKIVNDNVQMHQFKGAGPDFKGGMRHEKELSEIILPHIDKVVTSHYQGINTNLIWESFKPSGKN